MHTQAAEYTGGGGDWIEWGGKGNRDDGDSLSPLSLSLSP